MRSVTKYRIFGAAGLSGLIALAPAVMAQDVERRIQLVQYYDHDSGMAAKAAREERGADAKAAGEERGADAKAAGEERGAAAKAAGERHGDEAKYAGMRESEEAKEAGIRHSEAAKADSDYRAEHPYGYHHDHHHKPRPPYGD
jgi:hypothetical protein